MQASPSTPPLVFISHAASDSSYASLMEQKLHGLGIPAWNFNTQVSPGDVYLEKAKNALESCTHIMVLVGPRTRESQWVDMEMEVAMSASETGAGASLIGVILPHHEDFARPYYEPEAVPLRLHDFVRQGVALLKKWSEEPEEIQAWLHLADQRCGGMKRTRPSLSTLKWIREKAWNNEGEVAREGLPSLSSQHIRPE